MDIAYGLQVKLNELFDSSDIEQYREAWLEMLYDDEKQLMGQPGSLWNGNSESIASVKRMSESCMRDIVYERILNKNASNKISQKMIDLINEFRQKMVVANIVTEEIEIIHEDAMGKRLPGCYGMGKNR